MAAVLSENPYFKEYIREAEKLLKSSDVLGIRLKADKYFNHLVERHLEDNAATSKREEDYTFATVAMYRAIHDTYPDMALGIIERGADIVSKDEGEKRAKRLKIIGMKSIFMKNMGKDSTKYFGPEAGFKTSFISDNGTYVQFDVKECPVKAFTEEYGYPELAHVFCNIELNEYSGIAGIEFSRKHNLVDGDDCCDFRFEHINELIYGKK